MCLKLRSSFLAALAMVLMAASPALAQTGSITGRITAADTGAPLAGAQIDAIDASGRVATSAISGDAGQYRLTDLEAGTYALVVSLVGYETQRIEGVRVVAGGTSMQAISLAAVAFELNPIVVSASKRQEKVLDAPASVAVVDSRAVASRPSTTPVDHLRSVPGVDIAQQGVQATSVVVRGFNNIFSGSLHALTDNRIAGVPSLRVNVLHFIPATDDDVERMEVVLGPGAALYGPNTANGVLHIVTKSPLDHQGTSVSFSGGNRSLMSGNFRSSHLLGENFGIKLSGQYLQADEWAYTDPTEAAEKGRLTGDSEGAINAREDLKRAFGLDDDEVSRRVGLIGTRDFDVQRWSGDLRADWRINDDVTAVFAGGMTKVGTGIELTGLGAAQAKDWTYSYLQARLMSGRFFVQGYANMSNAGDTYLLRNGAPISDRSKLYVAQAQHGFSLGERQDFTYGLDFLYTNPVTEGTINGGYEDDDQTTEFGAYLQSETRLTDQLNLVLAGRIDTHSALPEAIFSPRAGLVFKPTEEHAFRVTYNRAFSTPSSINQFLDLGSALPFDGNERVEDLRSLGYSLRVQGTGANGFSFRGSNGSYMMRSPFNYLLGGSNADLLSANAATAYRLAAIAASQGLAEAGLNQELINYLIGLQPTDDQVALAYLDLNNPDAGPQAWSNLTLDKLDPIRESTSTVIEAGYKGVLADRVLLAADVWWERKENMVTPLLIQTPLVMLDGKSTGEFLAPALVQYFMGKGMTQEQAMAQAQDLVPAIAAGMASVPVGVISSKDVNAHGAQVLTTYINVDDAFDLYGIDLSATALITDEWQVSGTLSLVNDNLFETEKGEQVTLNAPKTKGSVSLAYRGSTSGLDAEVRARYNDAFPVKSGVYNGTLCIGGKEAGAEKCVDSYTLLDLTLGYRLPVFQGTSIQLSVQNLLDEDYRSFPGVPTIGRMALIRLKYDF